MTRWEKRLIALLVASVALNLLVLGFLVGRRLRHPHGDGHHGRHGVELAELDRLPGMRRAMERQGGDVAEQRKATRAARRRVREALVREPFDASVLDRELTALRTETARVQEAVHHALAAAAASATPEDRRELARELEKAPGGGRSRK